MVDHPDRGCSFAGRDTCDARRYRGGAFYIHLVLIAARYVLGFFSAIRDECSRLWQRRYAFLSTGRVRQVGPPSALRQSSSPEKG